MIKRCTLTLLIPVGAILCMYGSLAAILILGHLVDSGVSGKHLIFDFLLAMLAFGIATLLLSLSFVPLRFASRVGIPSWPLIAASLLPPIVLLGTVWIESVTWERQTNKAVSAIVGIGGLLIAYALEYRILQHLFRSRGVGRVVQSKFLEGVLTPLSGFLAVALALYAAFKVVLVAGAGWPTWSGMSFTGLLVLVLLRFLVVRRASNTPPPPASHKA